ncbi:hypothetical protein [Halalkalibacter lacteus]|uniref:hypothetical protein n=1 Tax=Halalkalibacter lacteus TaxID=3090663 RepID=UPI002FCC2FF6
MRKLFILLLSMAFSFGFFTQALAAQEEENYWEVITSIEQYISYLEEESKNDDQAQEILETFLNLSEADQENFIKALQPETYLDIIEKASNSPNEIIKYELDNGEEIEISNIDTIEYEDNSVEMDLIENFGTMSTMSTTYRVTTPWAVSKITIFGAGLTEFKTKLVYQSDGSRALQVYDLEKDRSNYNPAFWVTDVDYTNQYVSGGIAYGGYQWTLNATGSVGFISANYDQYVRANQNGTRQFKVNSNHHNLGFNWRNF